MTTVDVRYPWDNSLTGTVLLSSRSEMDEAIARALNAPVLPRFRRAEILRKAASILASRREEFANLITRESGLCRFEANYETRRSSDVLEFAAIEALKDDGRVWSCDVTGNGKARKIFTTRYPVRVALAITPFNHPLNQVIHKVAPAIAAGAPLLLKPSDKTPLTAFKLAEVFAEAGLPDELLHVFLCDVDDVLQPLIQDERVETVSFTGSVAIGKHIARTAGYKRTCLELGGNAPLIVLEDADLELAARLAAEGSFRNSGQRCTAVKRILVERSIMDNFCEQLVAVTKEKFIPGDPEADETRVGTVIDESAAIELESRIRQAVQMGATLLHGGQRKGALLDPAVLRDVPRDADLVHLESFGPIAPVLPIEDLDDAITYYNSGKFALSSSICTRDLNLAMRACAELKTGTTNVNEVPGFRLETTPFGGTRDSGLGVKEGVEEAVKFFTNQKTFSLPWPGA
ncbi:MAG: aldehyde dehydrogenase family protein [Verrucomicrobiota bacterium JB023]|nr:aldehyde dehydrogenase family protein [Verrucomicrobiota bacterium JB023]